MWLKISKIAILELLVHAMKRPDVEDFQNDGKSITKASSCASLTNITGHLSRAET